ncbi:2-dehydropantoate 2-reductase [Shimia sp. R10_1]|uniref:2-dehydropantoate 2-reductase n=1 Tax=Shimia sp. R10_1 TaxID=2821095 RepID=UPI001ADA8F79|nr:2-dehydropantoate 2-reductase [Shimia sp. R10_1]MBO9474177.1 2-dehydropantoate 2-reductase [Shimia sp. R10_1]
MSDAERSAIHPRIVVAGAGSIGCFVGGMLARSGRNVTLLLRAATLEEISQNGLTLTDFDGLDVALSPDSFAMDTDPACLAEADIVLVTVKSGATAKIAGEISRHAPKNAVIVSLQNGVENAANLQAALPEYDVRAGMVPFNVVWVGGGRFHRGTSGDIAIAQGDGLVGRHLSCPDLAVHERRDMAALQWGKLVINLNNALNALSGLPLRAQIGDRRWRALMAAQMEEALGILEGAAIHTQNPVAALPLRYVPTVLRLPTWLFRAVAKAMLSIDPNARSSMWEDLDRGRATEIDELQGQIVRLAEQLGQAAPINAGVAQLIREAVAADAGAPGMPIQKVQDRLRRA